MGRNKMIIPFFILFLLVGIIHSNERTNVFAIEILSRGITITVDQSGGGDYTTIQSAIDNASDGDTITVNPGVYYESLNIIKEIEIEGFGDNLTIINGTEGNDGITIYGNNSKISNIKIVNCTNGILLVNNRHNISISNCSFSEISWFSILSNYNCSDIEIINNKFINVYFGITTDSNYLHNSSRITINNNSFINCERRAIGISTKETLITNNKFYNIRDCIVIWNGNATIDNNYLSKFRHGIEVTGSSRNKINILNINLNNGTIGIRLDISSIIRPEILISNINIINMAEYGIFSNGIYYNLSNSVLLNCGNAGLYFDFFGGGTYYNNIISGNMDGIYASWRGRFILLNNSINNNTRYGIYVFQGDKYSQIRGNYIKDTEHGLFLDDCEEMLISENYFIDNNIQASKEGLGVNKWYAPYPIGGNYWSDHNSRDVKRGAQQALWGSDGFCDNSYTITGGGWDTYPIFIDKVNPEVRNISDVTIDPGTVYHFDCTESWDDQMVTSALWEFVYGDIPRSINHLEFDFQFNTTGVYPVNLTVYDYYGNSDRTSFNITVLDSTAPVPIVDDTITYYQGDTVTFNGSGSYDNAGIVNWTWAFNYEGEVILLYGETTQFTFIVPGYYDCTLFVSDEAGHTASLDFILPVVDLDAPVCDAGGDLVAVNGDLVIFDGSGSTDNSMIANYTWNFTYDGEEQIFEGETFSFYFVIPGYYTVYLKVLDLFGNVDTDERNITIADTHSPNAVINGSRTLFPGERLVLDGSSSTDNGRIVNYQWTFDDGGPVTILGELLDYEIVNIGEILVTLTVWDSYGNNDSTEAVITYLDMENPVANAGDEITIAIGTVVTFNGSASTDNGRIVKYQWEFIYDLEEVTLFGETQTFIFDVSGTYVVLLTVYDQSGNTGEAIIKVNVIGTGNIEGVVHDEDGKPIEGAKVTLLDVNGGEHSTTTDSMGRFSFSDIPMGKANYIVSKGGFDDFKGEVDIPALGTASIDSSQIILEEEGSNTSPNPLVFIALIILVLIIIAVVVFLVIQSKKKGKEETQPPQDENPEDTISPQEEPISDEISPPPMEESTIPDNLFIEQPENLQVDLQEDVFGNYELPPEETQQLLESPIENQSEPVEGFPQENTIPLDEEMPSEIESR